MHLITIAIIALILVVLINLAVSKLQTPKIEPGSLIQNQHVARYIFLEPLLDDDWYPRHLIEKGQSYLRTMCLEIEQTRPASAADLYKITHRAVRKFNALERELESEGSELETIAREQIAEDFSFVLSTYGYEVDLEEALAPRNW